MTHKEKYLQVEQERHDMSVRLAGLPDEIQRDKDGLKPLEDEIIRREILGEDAGNQRREIEDKREKIRRKSKELEDGQNKARVALAVLEDLRSKAAGDMTEPAKRRFFAGVKDLLRKLDEARQAEVALAAIQDQVRIEFDQIGLRCPIDGWHPVIIRSLGDPTFRVEISAFIDQMRARGFSA